MRLLMKRFLGLVCVCAVLFSLPVSAAAATAPETYSIEVKSSQLNFVKGGAVVGSYALADTDLTLLNDRNGNLLVQFNSTTGKKAAATLGIQKSVSVGGTMHALNLSSDLLADVAVTAGKTARITTLSVYNNNPVTVQGAIGAVNVYTGGDVVVDKGAAVTCVRLMSGAGSLVANGEVTTLEKVNDATSSGDGIKGTTFLSGGLNTSSYARGQSGLVVDNSNPLTSSRYTTSVSSGSLTVKAAPIYADYNDTLTGLRSALGSSVRAYLRSTGASVAGKVNWVSAGTTRVRGNNYYRFTFTPDNSRYGRVTGQVRIIVGNGSNYNDYYDNYYDDYYYDDYYYNDYYYDDYYYDDYYYDRYNTSSRRSVRLEIDSIQTSSSDDLRLSDLLSDLESSVRAYGRSTDDELEGTFKWNSSSTRVRDTDYYRFTFIPDSSRYARTTGRIKIYVD